MRYLGFLLLAALAASRVAVADDSADLARWQQPTDAVAREDDPSSPFISFFTPTYSSADKSAVWSMMAAKWRDTGDIDLSVGVRLNHGDEAPWTFTAASLADGTKLSLDSFPAIKTCTAGGTCVRRETVSLTLPRNALKGEYATSFAITIVTGDGDQHAITFPPEIIAALAREIRDAAP